jgi:hypothetical protein
MAAASSRVASPAPNGNNPTSNGHAGNGAAVIAIPPQPSSPSDERALLRQHIQPELKVIHTYSPML